MHENQNRLGHMPNRPLGEARLVVVDERDDVAAGDVAVVDDGEAGAIEVETRCCAISPAGMVDRMVRACSRPGNVRSSRYFAVAGDLRDALPCGARCGPTARPFAISRLYGVTPQATVRRRPLSATCMARRRDGARRGGAGTVPVPPCHSAAPI